MDNRDRIATIQIQRDRLNEKYLVFAASAKEHEDQEYWSDKNPEKKLKKLIKTLEKLKDQLEKLKSAFKNIFRQEESLKSMKEEGVEYASVLIKIIDDGINAIESRGFESSANFLAYMKDNFAPKYDYLKDFFDAIERNLRLKAA